MPVPGTGSFNSLAEALVTTILGFVLLFEFTVVEHCMLVPCSVVGSVCCSLFF